MSVRILTGDCRDLLGGMEAESVHCIVTSPPYFGLRDYGVAGQIGLEPSPEEFVSELVGVFREARRVLRDDGTLWLNMGDSYCSTDKWGGGGNTGKQTVAADGSVPSWAVRNRRAPFPGIKPKDLIGVPWMLAFALRADGWYLRSDIIWHKPNPMPESVTDRPTSAHEHIFLLSKSERYFYDNEAVKEPASYPEGPGNVRPCKGADMAGFEIRGNLHNIGPRELRNLRNVWTVATQPFSEAHFATFPSDLIEPCIKAGCPKGGTVLDPFGGAGTTGLVADRLGRNAVLIELNPTYADMARRRLQADAGMFANLEVA